LHSGVASTPAATSVQISVLSTPWPKLCALARMRSNDPVVGTRSRPAGLRELAEVDLGRERAHVAGRERLRLRELAPPARLGPGEARRVADRVALAADLRLRLVEPRADVEQRRGARSASARGGLGRRAGPRREVAAGLGVPQPDADRGRHDLGARVPRRVRHPHRDLAALEVDGGGGTGTSTSPAASTTSAVEPWTVRKCVAVEATPAPCGQGPFVPSRRARS
jgi:hypothetical protein